MTGYTATVESAQSMSAALLSARIIIPSSLAD
ncbi:hypothetical protein BHAP_1669 [Bifidobacterium hapali]|uniref:Uncharacterized protein n=1 Tax=Bifidobacterium hapali TaxID=1630172 RepID=A0A261FWZ8_9BIFI|nr:hypothetical protein BHAP_1669 [Bifidobacterium hapali]